MTPKRLIIGLLITYMVVSLLGKMGDMRKRNTLSYSDFVTAVQNDSVKRITTVGSSIIDGESHGGARFRVVRPEIPDNVLMDTLWEHNVEVDARKPHGESIWLQIFISLLPLILLFGLFMLIPKQLNSSIMNGRNGPLGFGRNRAHLHQPEEVTTTFADVAGVDEAREDVQELVEFLKDPEKFQKLGGRIPHGVLMVGPPGTGKTLLARAIAGEAGVPFFSISGSDFVEMFVGVGASRVRDMFAQARKIAPCIIFIDEIDAVGRQRGAGLGGGHDEREQTLNQLLVEMDGFGQQDGVIVIAATNRPDVLDGALLRPGRFDRRLTVHLPDIRGRYAILKVHSRKVPLNTSVDLELIARGTAGFSGADLANLVNESALLAARSNRKKIDLDHLEHAKDKIMMGSERRSMVIPEKEKRLTAYHESGHAIVGRVQKGHDKVYKVTIIPRGGALGLTMFLPEEDRYSHSRESIIARVCSLFGGRVAEELVFGKDGTTTGASNDIRQATDLVRNMVTKWGLSEALGPLLYDDSEDSVFLGRMAATNGQTKISDETEQKIDKEVRRIIDSCHNAARRILTKHRVTLDRMAEALMEYETLDSDQLDDIMAGKKPRKPVSLASTTGRTSTTGRKSAPKRKSKPKPVGVATGSTGKSATATGT